ncbi:MAG: hypothetical protein ABI183_07535 [Polyangiaceae bacterium]
MNPRSVLFLAATVIFAAGCTPSSTRAVSSTDPPLIAPKTIDHAAAAPVAEGGPLPDFSSANDVADAAAAPVDESMYAQENPPPAGAPSGVDVDDVREAVFRHMFGSNASGQGSHAGVFCLLIENSQDPTPGFLARMKSVKTPIEPMSGCSASANQGVVDKKTHARGLIFRIDRIAFKDTRHATVNGGYYEAGLSASGNIYRVERKANGWVVTKDEMTWIS